MVVHPRRLTSAICIILGCSILSIAGAEEKEKNNKGSNPPAAAKAPPPPPHVNAPPGGGGGGGNVGHPGGNGAPVHNAVVAPTGGAGYNGNAIHGNPGGAGGNQSHTQNAVSGNPQIHTQNAVSGNPAYHAGNVGQTANGPSNNAHTSTVQHTAVPGGTTNLHPAGTGPAGNAANGLSHTNVGPATNNPNTLSHNPSIGGTGANTSHTPLTNTAPNHTLNTTGAINHPGTATLPSTAHAPIGAAGGTTHAVTGAGGAGLAHPIGNGVAPGKPALTNSLGKPAYTAPPANAIAAHGANNATVLTAQGSQSVLGQVNGARGGMKGFNAHPLPSGQVTTHPNGALTLKTSNAQYNVRANGSVASYEAHGQSATFHANGSFASVHAGNMDIHHSPNGQRVVFGHQADHSLLVNTGWHSGYRESGVAFGGHNYLRRDYVYGHEHFSSYYSPYHYHGLLLAAFVATAIYVPAYYAWSYHPWGAPVAYHWGWTGSPWYGYYGNYFVPSPTYVGPNYWLTDYALASTLESGYDERPEAYGDAPDSPGQLGVVYDAPSEDTLCAANATPITPELKDAIAQEVAHQLQLQQQAAQSGGTDMSSAGSLQNVLQPNQVFIVADSLNATTPDQRTCGLSAGDVLQLQGVPGANDSSALLAVASGRRNDCPAGTQVQLSLQNLQDMQNNLSARIDSGLASLQKTQGTDGLPAAPGDALAPPKSDIPAPPDNGASDVQALLDSQWQQANQTETQVQQGVVGG